MQAGADHTDVSGRRESRWHKGSDGKNSHEGPLDELRGLGSDANPRIGPGTVTALRPVLQPVCSPVKSGQDRPRPSIQARWR